MKDQSLADLVHDANRFLLDHKEMIAEFPLQVYSSALLFSPEQSVIRKLFLKDHAPEWISIKPGLDTMWDMRLQSLLGHEDIVKTMVYSPDGQWIISGSEDGVVKLWRADSGNCEHTYSGFGEELCSWSNKIKKAGVQSVAFSGDSQKFTAASGNEVIKVWDLKTNQVEIFRGHEETSVVTTMAISPDGRTFAYGLESGLIHVWSMYKEVPTHKFRADTGKISLLSFTTDGRWLASVSSYGSGHPKIWNTSTGECKKEIRHWCYKFMAISGDGQLIAFATHHVFVCDTNSGQLIWTLECDSEPGNVKYGSLHESFNFSKDGMLLAASFFHCIRVWNMATGDLTWKTSRCEPIIRSLAFSPDSERLVTACFDRAIKVWDLTKGNKSMADDHFARSLCYSDEHHFAVCYPGCREIATWSTSTANDLKVQKFHADRVSVIAMSKDHQLLASASSRGQVIVWETKTGAHTQIFGEDSADAKGGNTTGDIDDETDGYMKQITSLAFRNSSQLACGS